jgi:DNA-binding transcriptional MerR regulator
MEYNIPDKLTFRRTEVIKLTKLDGKVIDYWEREFGGINPVINKLGEKFYTRQDLLVILKIKQMMIVEKIDKNRIKKILSEESGDSIEEPERKSITENKTDIEALKIIRTGLEEILTILDKNGK